MESVQTATSSIDRRTNLSYLEYVEEYVRPNKPVIVTDAMDHWGAVRKWTPSYFRDHYGSMDIKMGGLTMGQFIDMVESSEHDGATDLPYLRNCSLQGSPELKADISPLPIYTRPNWFDNPLIPKSIWSKRTALFIGGRSSGFPYLHYENYHEFAFSFQIYGEKEFTVFAPDQSPYLYPLVASRKGIANKSSIRDLDNPDLEKFPLFAKAELVRFVLKPGEMLFIPSGWWHTTRMHTVSISINSNAANSFNWNGLMSDHWRSLKTNPFSTLAGVPYLEMIRLCEKFRDVAYRNRELYSQRPEQG